MAEWMIGDPLAVSTADTGYVLTTIAWMVFWSVAVLTVTGYLDRRSSRVR